VKPLCGCLSRKINFADGTYMFFFFLSKVKLKLPGYVMENCTWDFIIADVGRYR
jgi:hypothetical protein